MLRVMLVRASKLQFDVTCVSVTSDSHLEEIRSMNAFWRLWSKNYVKPVSKSECEIHTTIRTPKGCQKVWRIEKLKSDICCKGFRATKYELKRYALCVKLPLQIGDLPLVLNRSSESYHVNPGKCGSSLRTIVSMRAITLTV